MEVGKSLKEELLRPGMSKTLGLHWSTGPGDTLRMIHALRCRSEFHAGGVVVTRWDTLSRFNGIWSGICSERCDVDDWWYLRDGDLVWLAHRPIGKLAWDAVEPPGCKVWDASNAEWTVTHLLKCTDGFFDKIVHPFVWNDDPMVMCHPVPWAGCMRQRIDRNRLMRQARFDNRPYGLSPKRRTGAVRVACVWRDEDKERERNTPPWLGDLVESVASSKKATVVRLAAPSVPTDRVAPLGGSYVEQMRDLAADFDCAIGVTSGGLDLAAGAGLPILRVGEFQDGGYPNLQGKLVGNWGRSYNLFLANDLNTGLAGVPPLEDFDRTVAETSIREFLTYVKETPPDARLAAHLLLPEGTPFEVDKVLEMKERFATELDADDWT